MRNWFIIAILSFSWNTYGSDVIKDPEKFDIPLQMKQISRNFSQDGIAYTFENLPSTSLSVNYKIHAHDIKKSDEVGAVMYDHYGYMYDLNVIDAYQKQGIGTSLLDAALLHLYEWYGDTTAWPITLNSERSAIPFYVNIGFENTDDDLTLPRMELKKTSFELRQKIKKLTVLKRAYY